MSPLGKLQKILFHLSPNYTSDEDNTSITFDRTCGDIRRLVDTTIHSVTFIGSEHSYTVKSTCNGYTDHPLTLNTDFITDEIEALFTQDNVSLSLEDKRKLTYNQDSHSSYQRQILTIKHDIITIPLLFDSMDNAVHADFFGSLSLTKIQ